MAALLGLFAICLTWLFTAELGVFKPQIERLVTDRLGREFSINGDLSINLGRDIELSANEIVLANAAWADEPSMLLVGRFAARVNLWSMVSGPVRVHFIDVEDITLRLTENKSREKNWDFELATADNEQTTPSVSPAVLLESLSIDTAHIVYDNALRPQPIDIRVESMQQQRRPNDMLEASVTATVNQRSVQLHGTLGTWTSLVAGRGIEIEADGRLDTILIDASGRIDDLRNPSRPELKLRVSGPSVRDLTVMLGLGEVGDGDIDLDGSLQVADDGQLNLAVDGNLGLAQIDASGRLAALDSLDNFDLKVVANGPSLGRLLSIAGIDGIGNQPFDVELDVRRTGSLLLLDNARLEFGDARLDASGDLPNFPAFDNATLSVRIHGQDVEKLQQLLDLPGIATGTLKAELHVKTDEFGKPLLEAVVENTLATVTAHGSIGKPPHYLGSTIDFDIRVPSLLQLGNLLEITGLPEQPASASGSIVRQQGRLELREPLQLRMEGIAATIAGDVQLAPGLLDTALNFEIEGGDLAASTRLFAADVGLPPLPYAATGSFRMKSDRVELHETVAVLGDTRVELDGAVSRAGNLSGSNFEFSATGPAVEQLFTQIDNFNVFPGDFETSGKVRLDDTNVIIKDFRLKRSRGRLAMDAKIGRPWSEQRLELDLDASAPDVSEMISDLGGFVPSSAPFSVKARVERNGKSWSFLPLQASLGSSALVARGQLELTQQDTSGSLVVTVDIPDLASLGSYRGRPFRQLPVHVAATVGGSDDRIVMDDLDIRIGDSDVAGRFALLPGETPDIELFLRSDSLTIPPALVPGTPEADEQPAAATDRLIPAIELPLEWLDKANVSFGVELGELKRNELQADNVDIRGELRDGALRVNALRLGLFGGTIESSGSISAHDDTGRILLDFRGRDLNLLGAADNPMDADIDFRITSNGTDLQQLAANSAGFLVLQSSGGEMQRNAAFDMFSGSFITELLQTVNPFMQSDATTSIECATFMLDITDGLISGKQAAFVQTDKIRVLANASVDLATERLQVGIRTHPRGNLRLISLGEVLNPYLSVEGTLAKPRIGIDEKGAVIAGGAAAATGGLSILARGVWDRLSGDKNPCVSMSEEALAFIEAHRTRPDESE